MNKERIRQLEQFVKDDANDLFSIYALALELVGFDNVRAAMLFNQLLVQHPDYLPTYYQAGNLQIIAGDPTQAKKILTTGIQKAASVSDFKTRGELQTLLDGLD